MEILLALAYIFLVRLVFFEYFWLSWNLFNGMVVLGLFQALFEAEEAGLLHDNQMMRMKEVRAWFNDKLDWPHRLSRFSKPHAFNQAITWFMDSAKDPITWAPTIACYTVWGAVLSQHFKRILLPDLASVSVAAHRINNSPEEGIVTQGRVQSLWTTVCPNPLFNIIYIMRIC